MSKSINELSKEVHENAKNKGFHPPNEIQNIPRELCLIHSEVSEALEADRIGNHSPKNVNSVNGWTGDEDFKNAFSNNIKNTFGDELADIVIRVMDLSVLTGVDLETHVIAKMRYNKMREHKHGKKY